MFKNIQNLQGFSGFVKKYRYTDIPELTTGNQKAYK